MKAKLVLFVSCFVAVMLAASVATAGPHGGNHFMSMPARGGRPFVPNGMGKFSGQHWNGGNWGGNWHHHHHDHDDFNNVVFIGGFPFGGWGWGWGYPYYGYPPYGYYPYGYYGSGYYGAGYGSYGYGDRSRVAALQRRLAHAGYYHGAIDGIMGPRTRRALHAYQRDHHGMGAYG